MVGAARKQRFVTDSQGALLGDDYRTAERAFWRAIYTRRDVSSLIRHYRQSLALAWVDELALQRGAAVLDVGCGAGLTAVELARRGLQVSATDAVEAVAEMAREVVEAARVGERVDVSVSDPHDLPFADAVFELVVAMGLAPCRDSPLAALCEMARVLKPSGMLIASCDPLLPSVWRRAVAPRAGRRAVARFDQQLSCAGFLKQEGHTFGFGPFMLVGGSILPRRLGVRVQDWLQRAAVHRRSPLRGVGGAYIVLARKG